MGAMCRHNSPLPWENDVSRANEKIFELWTALVHIEEYWNRNQNETAMYDALWHIIETATEAIDLAQKIEVEPLPCCGYFAGSKSDPRD